jgi:hypothetical protein
MSLLANEPQELDWRPSESDILDFDYTWGLKDVSD